MYNANGTAPELTHATITTAKPQVHASHPFNDQKSHEKLLNYIRARLWLSKQHRDSQIPRYAQIDKDVAGWMRLSEEDRKRKADQTRDGIPKATAINLPLNFVHLDDMMTYYAETFAPNRGMFYHTAKPDETEPATQIVTLMNNHSIYAGYYRQTLLSIFSILKYNLGGFHCRWSEDYGPKLQVDPNGGAVSVTDQKIWDGNRLEALDMYNTFVDPSVHPVDLHREGEWAGRAFIRSHYWLASRCKNGVYFNCDEALDQDRGIESNCTYYRSPPREAKLSQDESGTGTTNWVSVLSERPDYSAMSGFELVEVYIRINPNDFNLVPKNPAERNQYEVWRVTILNDDKIIETTLMSNIHGQLPFYFGLANDDLMGPSAKSSAEIIQPLQNFASSLLNTHVLANRSRLWGVTWYDPTVFNYDKIPEGEVAAYAPIEATGYGKNLQEHIYRDSTQLETKQTMNDLSAVMEIVNQFFPTQSLPSQIASIDRAVDSQVAAVQQGSNRRQHKTAKLLDDSLFRPARACMYYNIVQFQSDGVEVSDFTGRTVTVNLERLRETDLPFIIGQGLKAIDRMMIAGKLQSVIFALIQAPQASQQVNILALIDYWTSMMDIEIDFKQFALAPPQAQPGTEPGSQPPGQPAGPANAIVPARDPAAVTEPIR